MLSGDFAALKEAASTLLTSAIDAREKAFAHYYLGRAQLQSSEPEPARLNLSNARAYFGLNDPWMVVECMDWEAGALYALERPEALPLARESLAMCRQLKPIPISTEVKILGHLGAIHVSRHEWKEAISCYEDAVERAGPLLDLDRLSRMYQDLSLAYQETGALVNAASYARKALALHEMQQNREAEAWAQNNLGLILLKLGQLESGERHLQNALAIFEELGIRRRKSNLLLSLSKLELTRKAYARAEEYAIEALASAKACGEEMTAALAHQTLGELGAIQQAKEATDQQFAAALTLLRQCNAPQRILDCHLTYADILEKRGDWQGAIFQLRQALTIARSEVPALSAKSNVSAESISL
ncbi:MAG: hypothetical protein QOH92_185 [Chloroflexota bacterium]|nr:hypothetical protein [Chloroflexota bacterium]